MAKRILITGGSGFIGTNLVEHYLTKGWTVLSLDEAYPRNPAHNTVFEPVNLLDSAGMHAAMTHFEPNIVLHFGARTDLNERHDIKGYAANIDGVQNVISACRQCSDLRRLIVASTTLVCRYGYTPKHELDFDPSTLYGGSKVLTERSVREGDLPFDWTIVRPSSIWGPWFGAPYNAFFRFVLTGRYVHPGSKSGTSTYGYIGNTIYQIDRLVDAEADRVHGRVFYLGDLPPNNVGEWADEIARLAGQRKILTVPYSILNAAATLGDLLAKLGIRFPLTSFRLSNMTTDNICDVAPIHELAPNPPYTRADGVRATLNWLASRDLSK